MTFSKYLLPLAIAIAVAGCSGKSEHKTQKQQANEQWNAARAAVMGKLANDQYSSGNLDKSRVTLDEAIRLNPKNSNLRVLSARLAIEAGNLELADAEIKEAQTLDPKNAEADYLGGVIYQRWQRSEQAYSAYSAAVEKNPGELAYLLAKSEMLVAMERSDEALALLQEKVVFFENSAIIRDAVGQLLLQKGRTSEAVDVLRQASILATEDLNIREHLAVAQFHARQFRDSSDTFKRLFKDESYAGRADLQLIYGEALLQQNRFPDARAAFERAAEINPSLPGAWLSIAKLAMQVNDLNRAELSIRKAAALDPASGESYLLLGYVRLCENRLDDALIAFQKSSALQPGDTVSLCMIGFVYEQSGKTNEAMSFYARALQMKPGDELASKLMASAGEKE